MVFENLGLEQDITKGFLWSGTGREFSGDHDAVQQHTPTHFLGEFPTPPPPPPERGPRTDKKLEIYGKLSRRWTPKDQLYLSALERCLSKRKFSYRQA